MSLHNMFMRGFRRLMEINLTEWEGYVGVQEEILLKNIFNFLFYFNVRRVAQEEWFLVFGTLFSLCLLLSSWCDKCNLYSWKAAHFENEIQLKEHFSFQ